MYKSQNNFVSQFIAKNIKYRILFKSVLKFLGLDHRDDTISKSYLIVIGIIMQSLDNFNLF